MSHKKRCKQCKKKLKVEGNFYRHPKMSDGFLSFCKPCYKSRRTPQKRSKEWHRSYRKKNRSRINLLMKLHRLKKQGVDFSLSQYETMLKTQNGRCAICKEEETMLHLGEVITLAIDHDHVTKKVRGLLCCHCNQGLGKFRDRPELLTAALAYLGN